MPNSKEEQHCLIKDVKQTPYLSDGQREKSTFPRVWKKPFNNDNTWILLKNEEKVNDFMGPLSKMENSSGRE